MAVAIHELLSNRVLVTRESARSIAPKVATAIGRGSALQLDFEHVQGITPSFLDELLSVVHEAFSRFGGGGYRIEIIKPPTTLSSKFAAIGRGRHLLIVESPGGSWIIDGTREQGRGGSPHK